MLQKSLEQAGATLVSSLTVLLLIALALMMFHPVVAESTTLEDGLGPTVETVSLTI